MKLVIIFLFLHTPQEPNNPQTIDNVGCLALVAGGGRGEALEDDIVFYPWNQTTPPGARQPLLSQPHPPTLQYPIQSAETFNVPRNRGLVFFTVQSG